MKNQHKVHFYACLSFLVLTIFVTQFFFPGEGNGETTLPPIETTTTTEYFSNQSKMFEVEYTPAPETTTTELPKTPRQLVNEIAYIHNDPAPAMKAFYIVAKARGWSDDQINAWAPFAQNVMLKESGYCYNIRRGAIVALSGNCVIQKQGPYEDAGFAQLISLHYAPGKWLCEQEGLCSAEDIIATPWNSMTSFIALLERNGKQPWCYTKSLRATTRCKTAPKNPPAI